MVKDKKSKLRKLQELCKTVALELEEEPLLDEVRLSKKQRNALYRTLRFLDAAREYAIGYELRNAFGVETDNEKGKEKQL